MVKYSDHAKFTAMQLTYKNKQRSWTDTLQQLGPPKECHQLPQFFQPYLLRATFVSLKSVEQVCGSRQLTMSQISPLNYAKNEDIDLGQPKVDEYIEEPCNVESPFSLKATCSCNSTD